MTLKAKPGHGFLLLSAPVSLHMPEVNAAVNHLFDNQETDEQYTDPHPRNEQLIEWLCFPQGYVI